MDITEQLTHESRIALAAVAEIIRLRAENERLRGDNVHLRGHFERAWPDTQRYRWLRATNMEQQNILAHYAYTEMDAAIDAARAAQGGE